MPHGGAGRIAYHLARLGCVVTGIDLRRQFIVRARQRFRQERLKSDFRVMDLRKLAFRGEFQGIFNWHGSFGYFSEKENAELVRSYARALRRGGRLLIEQVNRERILRNFNPKREEGHLVVRNRWNRDSQRIEGSWIIEGVDDQKNRSSLRLYTRVQMCVLFKQADLSVEGVYGYPDGGTFSRSSWRMVTVGRKS